MATLRAGGARASAAISGGARFSLRRCAADRRQAARAVRSVWFKASQAKPGGFEREPLEAAVMCAAHEQRLGATRRWRATSAMRADRVACPLSPGLDVRADD